MTVLTLVSSRPPLTDDQIALCKTILKDAGIENSASDQWLEDGKAIDLFIAQIPDKSQLVNLRRKMNENSRENGIDIFVTSPDNRRKKLLIADMDSTILKGETLDELAGKMGLKDKVADITDKAMRGKMDFHAALKARVEMLKGMKEEDIVQTIEDLSFNEGARTLVQTLKQNGVVTILVTGGFEQFGRWAAEALGFDHVHANRLDIKNGVLTGGVKEPILDKHEKENLLVHYARIYGIDDSHTMAVGDGANDLLMLRKAGIGVGFRAKPKVTRETVNTITHTDLTSLLYIQGYKSRDIVKE